MVVAELLVLVEDSGGRPRRRPGRKIACALAAALAANPRRPAAARLTAP
jgi:hypothetical protein